MKYPECCYRIGNEFETNYGKIIVTGVKSKSATLILGVINENHGFIGKSKINKLVSITAETLAELARQNDEFMNWNGVGSYVEIRGHKSNQGITKKGRWKIRTYEPLGEFFLRVAKDRGYIK